MRWFQGLDLAGQNLVEILKAGLQLSKVRELEIGGDSWTRFATAQSSRIEEWWRFLNVFRNMTIPWETGDLLLRLDA